MSAHSQNNHFQNGCQEFIVTKSILINGLKFHLNPLILQIYVCTNHCWHYFCFIGHANCQNSKWLTKWLPNGLSIITCVLFQRDKSCTNEGEPIFCCSLWIFSLRPFVFCSNTPFLPNYYKKCTTLA